MRIHSDAISARQAAGRRCNLTKVRKTENRPRNTLRSWHICLMMSLITIAIVLTMVYSLLIGNQMTIKYTSQIDATMMIRYKAAMAHLWFEEIIAGDQYSNIEKVWKNL